MKISLKDIFLLFFKVGALLLGGGYVILPMLTSEMVEKRNWISKDELVEFYALSQCIPGIIAVNTAIFVGYKLRGRLGAITSVIAMITAPFLAIVLLATMLGQITEVPIVKNIFWGVGISIILLIIMTVMEIWTKSVVDKFSFLLFVLIFLATVIFNVSPVASIFVAAILGTIYKLQQRRNA